MGELSVFGGPFALWLAAGGLLLVGELATGSGWLLWPAVSAAAVALLSAVLPIGLPAQLVVFAGLTIASTLASRRWLRRRPSLLEADDVNDVQPRLLGRHGVVLSAIRHGQGRVLVDGCEWAAELAGGGELPEGAPVVVIERLDGARLKVLQR